MEIVRVNSAGQIYWGVQTPNGVVPADQVKPEFWGSIADLKASVSSLFDKNNLLDDKNLVYLPPIEAASRVFCIGLNYKKHVLEAGRKLPDYPSIFMRGVQSFVGHGQNIVKPSCSDMLDFEGELAVVIGKSGRHIKPENAFDHVFGLTCLAENSVRDFQKHAAQVTPGKNFDNSGAMGPYIRTIDEFNDLGDLSLMTSLNGQIVQEGKIDDLIFPIDYLLAYISTFTTLQAGDVIATGTPEGVGFKRLPPLFMKDGDELSVEISGLGLLSNSVVSEI